MKSKEYPYYHQKWPELRVFRGEKLLKKKVDDRSEMRVDRSYSTEGMEWKLASLIILTNFSIALLCRFNFCYGLSRHEELGTEHWTTLFNFWRGYRGSAVLMATDQKIFEDLIGCHTRWKILLFLKSTSGSIHLLNIWKKCSNTFGERPVKASRWW